MLISGILDKHYLHLGNMLFIMAFALSYKISSSHQWIVNTIITTKNNKIISPNSATVIKK